MSAVLLGAPPAVAATLSIPQGVDFEAWLNWVDAAGVTIPMATYHASLSFSSGSAGEVGPATITDLTNISTVGQIVLANTSPNMKLFMPAVVTTPLVFRRLRAAMNVTDPSLSTRRWLEADVSLDRGTGY